MLRRFAVLVLLVGSAACSKPPEKPAAPPPADPKAQTFADGFLSAYFDRYPETATEFGVPARHHDALEDNSLDALKAWEAKEDAMVADAKAIDPSQITSGTLRAAYAIARESLESDIQTRTCRNELWNVSQMTGWQVNYGYLITIQPVGNEQARKEALARWAALPTYLDTEIVNLREGLKLHYTAPKESVRIVLDQVNALVTTGAADSPFMSPAQRDKDAAFDKAFATLFSTELVPAFKHYRDFLKNEYLAGAREDIAVSANPDGGACYAASVRYHSSLPMSAADVHQLGLTQMESLDAEMKTIAERSFNTSDVPALLQTFRTDRKYMFKDRADLMDYTKAALARAKAAIPAWFGMMPKADVSIEPYPKFREKNAPNEYNPPAEDGSRGGLFYISAYQAEKKSRAPQESTTFHETIPGHHMQMSIALERKEIHPIGRYIYNSGYVEGWALYAERLADEMKLYSSDLDRMGMLSGQAFRAARLVVDSGIHTMGWTRQQATAYMLGELAIRRARDGAQQTMGQKFDIKAFHDRVLEDGGVPLTFLSAKIQDWAEKSK
jgi:uncharacterized protein (DUF885 family)